MNDMFRNRVRDFLLYGGIGRSDYDSIRSMVWERNLSSLRITASMAAGIGAIFLIINSFSNSGIRIPYLVLLCGAVLTLSLLPLVQKDKEHGEFRSMLLCYSQIALISCYATFLSVQPSNYDIPATSAIVFIALLPLSIDDRPIRMFAFMMAESILYLVFSHNFKSSHAFSLDAINTATFCVVGMVLYSIICTRNLRELHQSRRIERMSFQTIQTLANAIDAKDPYTKGHSARVSQYSVMMAERLGWKKERLDDLRCAALLHDIGKIGIPDSILNKPTKLTEVEYNIVKSHTTMGAEILRESTIVDAAENVAYCHHERYDGKGYPRGLQGKEISEEARIVSIADAFDTMNSYRVYRKACDHEYILRQLTEGRGKQFDPEYADILIDLWNQGHLEESLQSMTGWEQRNETMDNSLQEAVQSFISKNAEKNKLVDDIKNTGSYQGALNVEYNQFTRLYEFIGNLEKRFDHPFKLILVTLKKNPTEDLQMLSLDKAMFYMERAIRISIRDVDIVTQYNRQQFLVILLGTDLNGVKTAVDRIFKSYFRMNGSSAFLPSYSVVETGTENRAKAEK